MNSVDKLLAHKAEMTPKKGFNLVGLDDYGSPDEQGLYLVAHFDSKSDAEAEKASREKLDPDQKYFVYGSEP
jgi:hypothetical protein